MKILSVLSVCVLLLSCSPQYHIERADKHVQKALNKGAVITNKVDTLTQYDTITETFTRNDTTFITNTVIRYITSQGKIEYVTRQDKRNEFKLQKQVNRLDAKNERLTTRLNAKNERVVTRHDTKIKRIENRSWWYLWLLIGGVLGFLVRRYLVK
tara:strand:+ start:810 stop:1274 length:465 start_codon:yes stop_codon:yes gene_type:complete